MFAEGGWAQPRGCLERDSIGLFLKEELNWVLLPTSSAMVFKAPKDSICHHNLFLRPLRTLSAITHRIGRSVGAGSPSMVSTTGGWKLEKMSALLRASLGSL